MGTALLGWVLRGQGRSWECKLGHCGRTWAAAGGSYSMTSRETDHEGRLGRGPTRSFTAQSCALRPDFPPLFANLRVQEPRCQQQAEGRQSHPRRGLGRPGMGMRLDVAPPSREPGRISASASFSRSQVRAAGTAGAGPRERGGRLRHSPSGQPRKAHPSRGCSSGRRAHLWCPVGWGVTIKVRGQGAS